MQFWNASPKSAAKLGRLVGVIGLMLASAGAASAQIPAAAELLKEFGLSTGEIAQVESGRIVSRSTPTTHERDLATSFVFFVPITPGEFVDALSAGLMLNADAATLSHGRFSTQGSLDDLAGLRLEPDGPARAKRYASASGRESLNLSADENAAFAKLPAGAPVSAVEQQLRASLLARYQAYHAKGLDGIAPYARAKGGPRSAADDLRTSLSALKLLEKHAPNVRAALAGYPKGLPAGSRDRTTWVQLTAHGAPTIVLTHGLIVPDGDAYVAMQRQFYVSEGFNAEQAIAGILPAQGGTIVLYTNHTSTDQVAGFGGSAKRSIGSKLMASQLEDIFTKIQQTRR